MGTGLVVYIMLHGLVRTGLVVSVTLYSLVWTGLVRSIMVYGLEQPGLVQSCYDIVYSNPILDGEDLGDIW